MTLVFDAEPLLARFLGEPGWQSFVRLLDRVAGGQERAYISRVNLAEVRYKLDRRRPGFARGALASLAFDGVEPYPCEPVWEAAASLKARHPALSLGDAFAAATARHVQGDLVVAADKELRRVCTAEGIRVRRV